MSKMQDILDRAEKAEREGKTTEAIHELIEAIKLLSRGQAQIMGDFDDAQASRRDLPIGGCQ